MSRLWQSIARLEARRAGTVVAVAIVVALVLGIGAPMLKFETSQNALIGGDSKTAKDNEKYQAAFGGEPMLVLFKGNPNDKLLSQNPGDEPFTGSVADMFTPVNMVRMRVLEDELRTTKNVRGVVSPLDALQFARLQLTQGTDMFADAEKAAPDQAARLEARRAAETARVLESGIDPTCAVATDLDQTAIDKCLENVKFREVMLTEADGTIREPMRNNFVARKTTGAPDDPCQQPVADTWAALTDPACGSGLMIVRLEGNLSIADMGEASVAIENAVRANPIPGFSNEVKSGEKAQPLVTGPPVLLKDINDYLQGGMATLGLLAAIVMTVVLLFVFRHRWRLLSLGIVAIGIVAAFGIMGFIGLPLNLVTISGLPILVGLGVDFAIQMHSRFDEEIDHGREPAGITGRVMSHLGPALALAMIAAVIGFSALQLSRVPMIRQLGFMLMIGVAVLFFAVILVPLAALTLRERRKPTPATDPNKKAGFLERAVEFLALVARPVVLPLTVVAVVILVFGLAVGGRVTIQTDPERWVPQDGETVKELKALRENTGFSSELGFLVRSADTTSTPDSQWIDQFGRYEADKHPNVLLRPTSLPEVINAVTTGPVTQDQMARILGVLRTAGQTQPAMRDVHRSFVTEDDREQNLVFPIAPVSLGERQTLLDEMNKDLEGAQKPPAGTTATPSGLAVVGIALVNALEANREAMTFLALGLVALWLLIVYRSLTKTLLTLMPVVLAVGAAEGVAWLTGLELSPLTTVSAPLIIAVCAEFSILIMSRYTEERGRGRDPVDAVRFGAVRIGRAFVASGLTLFGGFLAIALSPFPLLRGFGILVSLKTVIAVLSALMLLPPLLIWADGQRWLRGFKPGGSGPEVDLTDEEAGAPAPVTGATD